ncbi:MAG: IclR family transcriptional regulator [Tetrasphaera sp.]|nr:IclR family transcriptional regulator [Tetrasphaera sp.]
MPTARSSAARPGIPRPSAAGKALAVLACFDRGRPALTLTDLAHRSGLPLSTTHRVVGELATWGALERTAEGSWQVGLRLWEVASACPRTQILREVSLPFMQDLYEATHENIQLGVREGTELVFVERIAGHRSIDLKTMVGTRFPLTATGIGMTLLAFAPSEIREAVLAEPVPRHTSQTVTDPRELRAMLAQIRRSQVAVNDRQLSENTVGVAAPIRVGLRGEVQAALGIVVAGTTAGAVRHLRAAVLAASRAVSVELGARARTGG